MTEGKGDESQDSAITQVESRIEPVRLEQKPVSRVSVGRRQFSKAGLLAPPILMSITSRPVFGAACLSNMLSGNLSNPERGMCEGAAIVEWTDAENWPIIDNRIMMDNLEVAIVPDTDNNGVLPKSCTNCVVDVDGDGVDEYECAGGTLFNAVFDDTDEERSMYRILCEDPDPDSDEAAIIKLLLYSLTVARYPVTPMQVQYLWAGRDTDFFNFLFGFGGLNGYLESTLM